MSDLAWLRDAINAAENEHVISRNQSSKQGLVTDSKSETLAVAGLRPCVTNVTSVITEKHAPPGIFSGKPVLVESPYNLLPTYPDADESEPAANDQEPATYSLPSSPDIDDRIRCTECHHFTYGGSCSIAYPGSPIVSAMRGYRPALPDMLQRCAGHEAKPLKGQDHD